MSKNDKSTKIVWKLLFILLHSLYTLTRRPEDEMRRVAVVLGLDVVETLSEMRTL